MPKFRAAFESRSTAIRWQVPRRKITLTSRQIDKIPEKEYSDFVRSSLAFGLLALLGAFLIAAVPRARSNSQSPPTDVVRRPVIVELFTSEGCSSCPPADQLLQKLVAQQPIPNAEIIAIEEHVDYWNHDGWIDPFSSAEWTQRQLVYTPQTADNGPYTPQMVVDGRVKFVGSDQSKAVTSIQSASAQLATDITLAAGNEDKNSREFTITVGKLAGASSGDAPEVWLAVTEDGLHSAVTKGENAGHALSHVGTLRGMHKIGDIKSGSDTTSYNGHTKLKLDSHWNLANVRVIAFVQERKSRAILGASSLKLSS